MSHIGLLWIGLSAHANDIICRIVIDLSIIEIKYSVIPILITLICI